MSILAAESGLTSALYIMLLLYTGKKLYEMLIEIVNDKNAKKYTAFYIVLVIIYVHIARYVYSIL